MAAKSLVQMAFHHVSGITKAAIFLTVVVDVHAAKKMQKGFQPTRNLFVLWMFHWNVLWCPSSHFYVVSGHVSMTMVGIVTQLPFPTRQLFEEAEAHWEVHPGSFHLSFNMPICWIYWATIFDGSSSIVDILCITPPRSPRSVASLSPGIPRFGKVPRRADSVSCSLACIPHVSLLLAALAGSPKNFQIYRS